MRVASPRTRTYYILSGQHTGSPHALLAIAGALNISPILMFRKAGLLPSASEREIRLDEWEHLLDQLNTAEQDELYRIGERMVEHHRRSTEDQNFA
jgi:hypothetical protein